MNTNECKGLNHICMYTHKKKFKKTWGRASERSRRNMKHKPGFHLHTLTRRDSLNRVPAKRSIKADALTAPPETPLRVSSTAILSIFPWRSSALDNAATERRFSSSYSAAAAMERTKHEEIGWLGLTGIVLQEV